MIALGGALVIGIGLPNLWISRKAKKRAAQFNLLFPEAIDLIVRALRAGLPVQEAIANVARDIKEPVGGIFRRAQQEMQLGAPIEAALWRVARTVQTDEFNFLIVAMSIQRDTGGNLAETLANLSSLLRARQQLRLKIRAFTSEARATMLIMTGLPFLVGGGLFLISPNYIGPLFITADRPDGGRRRGLQHGRRHLHHEQDRDHQGLTAAMDLAGTEQNFTVLVAVAAFVTFWALWTALRLAAADRGAAGGAAHPSHEDAQRTGGCRQAVAQGDVDRLHALARRPPQPAARRGGRPDDAQAAAGRLPVARRRRRLRLHQARPAAGAGLPDDPADRRSSSLIDVPENMILPICMGAVLAGFVMPELYIKNIATKRREILTLVLPEGLDLLTICVEAGLSIDAAFRRVAKEMREPMPELSAEFEMTAIELTYLPDRQQALENMTERSDSPAIAALVNALRQTEKYGTPLADSLRILSQEFRQTRASKAEEKGARMPALMTVPLMVFILPTLITVLLAPAIMSTFALT